LRTTSIPSTTLPKTTCFPSSFFGNLQFAHTNLTNSVAGSSRHHISATKNILKSQNWNACKGLFGLHQLKFNSHHINVPSNAWNTKCRLIACMSAQIRSNLRDESIKPN
jgi:hypothetical protein